MPERDKFPKEYFTGNPLEGDPVDAYRRLQWGNEPREILEIEAPEPLAVLGDAAQLKFVGGGKQAFEEGEFFLAVGVETNHVYLVPKDAAGKPKDFPQDFDDEMEAIAEIKQTDYTSEKGGDDAYYFHEHEGPFPVLYGVDGFYVLLPADSEEGRSYAVNDEGIIG